MPRPGHAPALHRRTATGWRVLSWRTAAGWRALSWRAYHAAVRVISRRYAAEIEALYSYMRPARKMGVPSLLVNSNAAQFVPAELAACI